MQLRSCDEDIDAVSKLVPRVESSGSLQDIEFLSKGMFGHVRKVTVKAGLLSPIQDDSQDSGNHRDGDQRRPLVFASKHINLRSKDPVDAASQLANEARILSHLDHENIIKLRAVCSGSFSASFDNNPRGYFLLFDVLDVTLQTRLVRWRNEKRKNPSLCSSFCKKISKRLSLLSPRIKLVERCQRCKEMNTRAQDASVMGIARGLEYLHSKQILWRDLKPANIGYYRNNIMGGKNLWTVKLIDFGMARRVEDCIRGEFCGSLAYMAPETMRGQQSTSNADVFALGVVLSEICSLCIPYTKNRRKRNAMDYEKDWASFRTQIQEEGLRPMDNLEKIICCPETRHLIYKCWDHQKNRPSCTEIVARLDGILNPMQSNGSDNFCTKISRDLTAKMTEQDL